MRLFVANVTHQRCQFFYRLDFNQEGTARMRAQNDVKSVIIEPGRQVTIGGDLMPEQAQLIMDQASLYGGVGVEEIPRLDNNKKVVFLLSFGKEIPMKQIRMMDEHNKFLLTGLGDTRRRMAAIAMHPIVDQQIDSLKRLDVEMVEAPPEPGDPEPVGKPLDFGVHLDPNARVESKTKPPKARKSRRPRGE